VALPEPRIERSLTLHFYGDWGQANLHRVFNWLSQEMVDRTGPYSRYAIWNGRGVADAVRAVGRGQVDVALAVPVAFIPAALEGRDLFAGEPFPHLRGLGVIPQDDRMLLALDARLGIRSFDDLRAKRPPLRLATSMDDGENTVGYAAWRILEAAGISRETLLGWGGSVLEAERPDQVIGFALRGEADAVFHEAVMAPWWREYAERCDLAFLSVEETVLDRLGREHGYLRGMSERLDTLDFSDFLMICRADLPEDVAYLLTWCMCETRANLERVYRHIPPERAGITYPLVPARMAKTRIPLHPGAARLYDALGVL
jgi:TRAP-type uncharacterized transport system substrate-binding protein